MLGFTSHGNADDFGRRLFYNGGLRARPLQVPRCAMAVVEMLHRNIKRYSKSDQDLMKENAHEFGAGVDCGR